MSNIIKRRKTSQYTQINNLPIQQDLGDLAAIGLLTYIMSLPEDWVLRKTHLQTTFSRKRVDSAWKVLVEKKYVIGMTCHVGGHKNTYYLVSDIPFTQADYEAFLNETIESILETGKSVTNVLPILHQNLDIEGFYSDVQNVHYIPNSRKSVYTKEIKTKETKTNKHLSQTCNFKDEPANAEKEPVKEQNTKPVINDADPIIDETEFVEVLTDAANEFYNEVAIGRWNKKQWITLVNKFVADTAAGNYRLTVPRNKIKGFVYTCLKNIANNHDYNAEMREFYKTDWTEEDNQPIATFSEIQYNWLEER